MTTPNMGLDLPIVSTTVGPDWATKVYAALLAIDLHDHTSGKGARVTPAGFNWNAAFDANGFSLIDLSELAMSTPDSAPTTTGSLYRNSAGDLFWRDGTGAVQITESGSVKVSGTGNIFGIIGSAAVGYNTTSKSFSFIEETSTNNVAALLCGTVVLHKNSLLTGNTVTLKADDAASADYDYAFCPDRPGAANVIMVANLTSSKVTNVWKAILGTSNQVTVTQNASDITFSLPQSIHTGASPTFTGLTLSGLTASQVVVSNGSKALASLAYAKTNTTDTIVQRDGTSINANLVGEVAASTITNSGYTSLGNSTPPAFKMKKIAATWSDESNPKVVHGMTASTIKAVIGSFYYTLSATYIHNNSCTWDTTYIYSTNSASRALSCVLYVFYEAS
jgi:hypothetical protein